MSETDDALKRPVCGDDPCLCTPPHVTLAEDMAVNPQDYVAQPELPLPLETFDGGHIVASVWVRDDEPPITALLLILRPDLRAARARVDRTPAARPRRGRHGRGPHRAHGRAGLLLPEVHGDGLRRRHLGRPGRRRVLLREVTMPRAAL